MHGNQVSSGINKGGNQRLRLFNHQMNIKQQMAYAPDIPYHGRTDGQVGNKMSIHNINMQPIRTGLFKPLAIFPQLRKVCG